MTIIKIAYKKTTVKKTQKALHKQQNGTNDEHIQYKWFVTQINAQRQYLRSRTLKTMIFAVISFIISFLAILISVLK